MAIDPVGALKNSLPENFSPLPYNYLYISHLDEGLKFWQLPCEPDTVSDTMTSTFTPNSALGRSAPVYTYSNSGPRTVQVQLTLRRDALDDINIGWSNSELIPGEDYLENLIRALQAIALPRYNLTNKAIEPPLLALRLGQDIFIKGVLNGNIGLEYQLPLLANGKRAQVTLSLSINEVDPYDACEVYKNGGFRGMTKTLDMSAMTIEGKG